MATTRNSAFKSPSPRLPHGGPSHFLHKLDPWFVGLANLFKESAAPPVDQPKRGHSAEQAGGEVSPPPAVLPEFPRTFGEMLGLLAAQGDPRLGKAVDFIQQGIPTETLAMGLNQVLPNIISLLKYQVTVPELQWQEMHGDRSAGREVVETADIYNRWLHDQLPPEGVRFKTTERHNLLMLFGLAGGLKKLTSRELTDFFDEFCPCGQTHTLEVLRRLRRKLLSVLERGRKAITEIGGETSL